MGMIAKQDTSETSIAYGTKLDTPIPFGWNWTEYETNQDMLDAGDTMSLDQQRRFKNARRAGKARQAAMTLALKNAGYEKPDINNSDQLRLKEMFKVLMSSKKYSEEAARAKAAEILDLTWSDEADDESDDDATA